MLSFYGRKIPRKAKGFQIDNLRRSNFFFNDGKKLEFLKKQILKFSNLNLEIGFGGGENIIFQATSNQKEFFLACDPFLKGSLKLKKRIDSLKLKNILLTNLDFQKLSDYLEGLFFEKIYILFPDPWPKKKHKKRRLINDRFVNLIDNISKRNTKIVISTDNKDYLNQILYCFHKMKEFRLCCNYFNEFLMQYMKIPQTSYFKKAQKLRNKSYFVLFEKLN